MRLKRLSSLFILLLLAGCYQQATDTNFEMVNSQADNQPTADNLLNPNIEATPIVIVPAGASSPTPQDPLQVQPTTEIIPTNQPLVVETTPTVVIIVPSVPSNTPAGVNPSQLLPTSTLPVLITPQAPSQLVMPTATAVGTTSGITSTNGIITPTALPSPTNSACVYVIQSGDNLFRIAVNNDSTLDELLALNNLTENAVIQPGQELQIPNCDENLASATPNATSAVTSGNGAPATLESGGNPASGSGSGNTVKHVVESGETLTTIALKYGVTVNDIVNANNLTNPDRLAVGDELIIPNQ